MISEETKKRWVEHVASEYPMIPESMIMDILDLYSQDPDWVNDRIKVLKKEHKGVLKSKRQMSLEEFERLDAIGKAKVKEIEEYYAKVAEEMAHEKLSELSVTEEDNGSTTINRDECIIASEGVDATPQHDSP